MNSARRHRILVFGNILLKKDNLPLRILGRLRKKFPEIEFKEFDPTESFEEEGRELLIIDAVEGIRKVTVITDMGSIAFKRGSSVHDFDLGYSLRLLKKLGYIDSVTIFGVPMKISEDEALRQLSNAITSSLS